MPYSGVSAETVTIKGHNGDDIEAYYGRPSGSGPFPGVVVIHHVPGWDEWTTEVVRKFAHHGYIAISPAPVLARGRNLRPRRHGGDDARHGRRVRRAVHGRRRRAGSIS